MTKEEVQEIITEAFKNAHISVDIENDDYARVVRVIVELEVSGITLSDTGYYRT